MFKPSNARHLIAALKLAYEIASPPIVEEDARAALRLECRKLMALLGLLADERVPLAELRSDGLDADIARLCGL
jgi:hypothetical protein